MELYVGSKAYNPARPTKSAILNETYIYRTSWFSRIYYEIMKNSRTVLLKLNIKPEK